MSDKVKISTKDFSEILYKNLLICDDINDKRAKLLILWLLKYFQIYQSFYLKKTPISIIKRIGLYSRNNSSFILAHSFSSLINYEADNTKKNFRDLLYQSIYNIRHSIYSFIIINKILFSFNVDNILIFCSEKISQKKITSYLSKNKFFNVKYSKCIPVLSFFARKRKFKIRNKTLVNKIHDICYESINFINASSDNSEYDYLIDRKIIIESMLYVKEFLPDDFLDFRRSLLQSYISLFPCRKLTIVDDYVRVIRNSVIRNVFEYFDCDLIGMQHGAQYGEISSFLLATEIHNPVYSNRFAGWAFGLGNYNFRKPPSKKNIVKTNFSPCVLYPVSMDSRLIQSIDISEEDHKKIDLCKKQIISVLRNIELNYWIKNHPKSGFDDVSNIGISDRFSGYHKPGLDPNSIKLVIFDSPGQSFMYHCLDNDIPFIFCFNPQNFALTDNGKKFYSDLSIKDQFVNTLYDFPSNLKFAIKNNISV